MAQHAAPDAPAANKLAHCDPEHERNPKPVGPNGFDLTAEEANGLRAPPPDWACAASNQERPLSAPCVPPATPEGRVWNACEAGGLSMMELQEALKADASAQEYLVAVLGEILDATVEADSAGRAVNFTALPRFESSKPCPLSPSAYLSRMMRYTAISPCNILVGVIYLQRLKDKTRRDGAVRLTRYNCQRLLLCANMLASKFFDDLFMSNQQWARVGDLTAQEMNALELDMLVALDFDLFIRRETYNEWSLQIGQMLRSLQATKAAPGAAPAATDSSSGCDKHKPEVETRPAPGAVCAETLARSCTTRQQPPQDRLEEAPALTSAQPTQQQGREQQLQERECLAHQHQQHPQSCHSHGAAIHVLAPRLLRQREPEKRQDKGPQQAQNQAPALLQGAACKRPTSACHTMGSRQLGSAGFEMQKPGLHEAPNGPLSSSTTPSSSSSLSSTPRATPTGSPVKTLHHGRASGTSRPVRNLGEVLVSSDELLRQGFTVKCNIKA